jgi:hypothetical protein
MTFMAFVSSSFEKRVQVLHFKPHVIHNAAGSGDVSEGLVALPPEEVEAVSDDRQSAPMKKSVCPGRKVALNAFMYHCCISTYCLLMKWI